MRQTGVHREFDHLGVDHEKPKCLGGVPVHQARNDRVQADRLPRTGRASDEQVRHLFEGRDVRLAVQIFPQSDWQLAFRPSKLRRFEDLAKIHDLSRRVRNLDTHGSLPGNRCDNADRSCFHGEREVRVEVRDSVHLHAGRRDDLELRDDGPGGATAKLTLDVERPELLDQNVTQLV